MLHWAGRMIAAASLLLLTGCLWGPGKFESTLTLKGDRFTLDYRGEMVLQLPPDESASVPWKDSMARCTKDGGAELQASEEASSEDDNVRRCTASEIAELKSRYDADMAEKRVIKSKESAEMAKAFGLPGLDDESARAFADKLTKYAGWRSVEYRGQGVFVVDYHFEGRATQDFLFPALPDNDMLVPFVAIRRRSDGSLLVTAPAMTGGSGPMAVRGGLPAAPAGQGPKSRAEGRFTIVADGEVLTNNSEDGPKASAGGKALTWDVTTASTKIPEALIRLR